jgi:hypothetical protein
MKPAIHADCTRMIANATYAWDAETLWMTANVAPIVAFMNANVTMMNIREL